MSALNDYYRFCLAINSGGAKDTTAAYAIQLRPLFNGRDLARASPIARNVGGAGRRNSTMKRIIVL